MIALRLFLISLPGAIATGLVAGIGGIRRLFGIPIRRVTIHVAGPVDPAGFQFCEMCECELCMPGLTPWESGALIEHETFGGCATRWAVLGAKENWVAYSSCRAQSGIAALALGERVVAGR